MKSPIEAISLAERIGISGVARAGKDSFATILLEVLAERGVLATRFAFANELKREINPFLIAEFGISAWTSDSQEKKVIRPRLVEFGRRMRNLTQGTHWIRQVEKSIEENRSKPPYVITDVRYKEFSFDEVDWIKNEGVLIHVSRILPDGTEVCPANRDEAENDPRLRRHADFLFSWPTFGSKKNEEMEKIVKIFLESNGKTR